MTQLIEMKKRHAFSGWPMILGWAAMLIFTFQACTRMVGAGDTWVAMACGRHFINHGVDTVEPFSANSHRAGPTEKEIKTWPKWAQWLTDKVGTDTVKYWHPTGWVNQNWLTHVTFYWLTHLSPFADADTFSFNSLVYWKFAVYILTIICVFYTARLLGAHPALAVAFSCFALFTARSFLDIRPAGFSNLLVAVFLLILTLTTCKNILYIWLIVPLTVLWCNLHGGYIYVFIMLIPFVGLNFLTSFFPKRFVSIGLKGIYHTIVAGFAALVAAIIFNPFHLTNLTHTFVISLSKHAEMWRTVNEWHGAFKWSNPVGTGFSFLVLFILCIGTFMLWFLSRFLKPAFLKAPKKELEAQKKAFVILSRVFGWIAAIFLGWIVFISFSFLNLDPASFLFCAGFVVILLLSVCKNIHFIHLAIPLTLVGLWAAGPTKPFAGRYIYPFLLIPCYVIADIIAAAVSDKIKSKRMNIVFAAGAAVAALILMVLLINPFKFELPIWNIKQFWYLGRLYYPVYEKNVASDYRYLFPALYIVNALSVIVWFTAPYLKKIFDKLSEKSPQQLQQDTYQLPKIDLALIAIAALTVYMAVRSRRFIPIAAIAACPVLAMFLDQMVRTFSAVRNFHKCNYMTVGSVSNGLRWFIILLAIIVVGGLGGWWGWKFKYVYLDAWPTHQKLTSVFMRMTASDAKPFKAAKFIRDNKLRGKMFNYWTEGGFIAWGQEPDPNTGKTPLQLFMDGRAQAAYEPAVYEMWAYIMTGGPIGRSVMFRNGKFTSDDYLRMSQWVDKELKKYNVWAVLMPLNDQTRRLVTTLGRNPNWALVFFNNRQKLFVDITKPQGRELFRGILTGQTIYPDEFSKNLIFAHNMLFFSADNNAKKQGLKHAVKALELEPSPAPMREIALAGERFYVVRNRANSICEKYLYELSKN
ncbi:MAG: hypothetical protein ACYSRR_03725, partial [Planctomycetota bacterium]